MEEYSSEEVYSLCFPTVRREYSSFGVEDWRSSLLSILALSREVVYSLREVEREKAYSYSSQIEKTVSQRKRISLFFSTGIVVFSLRDSSSLFLFLWSIYVVYTLSFSVLSTSSRGRLERVIANLVVVFSLLTYIEYTLLQQQQQQSAYAVRYDFSNSLSSTREQRRRNSSEVALQQTT